MKIVCENCSAKYSIADEKVKGKVFKIRCKKCGESIVVKGDTEEPVQQPETIPPPMPQAPQDEETEADTRVFDYSGYQGGSDDAAVWHIVVEGQEQGPYTSAQIEEYLEAGSLDYETYVWREGFDDWLPIKEIPELLSGAGQAPQAAEEANLPASVDPVAPLSSGGLFDAEPAAQSGGGIFDQPAGEAGLFSAQNEPAQPSNPTSPFSTSGGLFGDQTGNTDDVMSSTEGTGPATGGLFNADENPEQQDAGLFSQAGADDGDLFGDIDADDGNSGGLFSSADGQAASPRVDAADMMMTGQRSENSVLFSLSNLQALAASPSQPPPPADSGGGGGGGGFGGGLAGMNIGSATTAHGDEASGLIDIRALASTLSSDKENTGLEDLISMGGGGFSPALGAPVLAPQKEGMSLWMKVGIAGGGVVLLAIIVILLVVTTSSRDGKSDQQILALKQQINDLQKGGLGDSSDMEALRNQLAAAQTGKATETSAPDKADKPKKTAVSKDGEESGKAKSQRSSSRRSSSSSKRSKSSSTKSEDTSTFKKSSSTRTAEPAKPAKPASKRGGSDELDDLLGGSLGGAKKKPARKPASKTSSSSSSSSSGGGAVKKSLDRGDVQKGMNGVAGRVKRCSQGQRGTVVMKVVIGKTGRVQSASATGPFAGSPVGSCAARAVRGARFPKTQQNLTVKYPFKL